MALSKEEKDELNAHFKGKDIYDPSKEASQEVATFAPTAMACGGMAEGYAEGGDVDGLDPAAFGGFQPSDDFAEPSLSDDTQTARGQMTGMGSPPPDLKADALNLSQYPSFLEKTPGQAPVPASVNATPAVLAAPRPSAVPIVAPGATSVVPQGSGKLAPNEFDALIKHLTPSTGQKIGQGAFSGLAALADAIQTGVARAPSSNFQKNMTEAQQAKRADLIAALKAKYEAGYKGEELGLGTRKATEEERHNKSAEKIGSEEAAARLAEAKSGLQQNALEAMGRLSESGGITGRVFGQPTQAQEAINALAERAGLRGPAQPKGQPTPHDLQAVQWAKANPNDPRAAKILKLNGQ